MVALGGKRRGGRRGCGCWMMVRLVLSRSCGRAGCSTSGDSLLSGAAAAAKMADRPEAFPEHARVATAVAGRAGGHEEKGLAGFEVWTFLASEVVILILRRVGNRSQAPLRSVVAVRACRQSRRRGLGGGLAVHEQCRVPPRLHFPVLRRRVDDGRVWRDGDAVLMVEVQAVVRAAPLVGAVGRWAGGA